MENDFSMINPRTGKMFQENDLCVWYIIDGYCHHIFVANVDEAIGVINRDVIGKNDIEAFGLDVRCVAKVNDEEAFVWLEWYDDSGKNIHDYISRT